MARFFTRFPFTNLNNLNLDWIIEQLVSLSEQVEEYISGGYIKPADGIPKSDLSAPVQHSLDLADSALQEIPDTYRTAAAQDVIDNAQDAKINPLYTDSVYSGTSAEFNAAGAVPIVNASFNIDPIQIGSGDPAITNLRPISGRSTASISVAPSETSATEQRVTLDFGRLLYGAVARYRGNNRWTVRVERAIIRPVVTSLQSVNQYGIANYLFAISPVCDVNQTNKAICTALVHRAAQIGIVQDPGFYLSAANRGYLRLPSDLFDTVERVNDWIQNAQIDIVYYLATPYEFDVDGAGIATLVGSNYISADSGDINIVIGNYISDLYAQIAQAASAAIIAPVESSATTTREYTVGDYFIYRGQLCRASAAIQNGGTIEIGVNAVVTTVGAELKTALI